MPRYHFRESALRGADEGDGLLLVAPNPQVTLYVAGTGTEGEDDGTPYPGTVYAGPTGPTALPNPFYGGADGTIEFWVDEQDDVKVAVDGSSSGVGVWTIEHATPAASGALVQYGAGALGDGTFLGTDAYRDESNAAITLADTTFSVVKGSAGVPVSTLAAIDVAEKHFNGAQTSGASQTSYRAMHIRGAGHHGTATMAETQDYGTDPSWVSLGVSGRLRGVGRIAEGGKFRVQSMPGAWSGYLQGLLGEALALDGSHIAEGIFAAEFPLTHSASAHGDAPTGTQPTAPLFGSVLISGGGTYKKHAGIILNSFIATAYQYALLIPPGLGAGKPIETAAIGIGANMVRAIEAHDAVFTGEFATLPFGASIKALKASGTTLYNLLRMGAGNLVEIGDGVTGTNVVGGLSTGGAVTVGTDLIMNAGRRITGNFTTGTLLSRTIFQTSTASGATHVTAIPATGGSLSSWQAYSNATANQHGIFMASLNGEGRIQSFDAGAGTAPVLTLWTGLTPTERLRVTALGSVIIGNSSSALATTATDGYLMIPTCAGTPTGVPTPATGSAGIVYDTTNNKLYVYNQISLAWKGSAAFT